jgi:hypothetical protein
MEDLKIINSQFKNYIYNIDSKLSNLSKINCVHIFKTN